MKKLTPVDMPCKCVPGSTVCFCNPNTCKRCWPDVSNVHDDDEVVAPRRDWNVGAEKPARDEATGLGEVMRTGHAATVRKFETGATRDSDEDKFDYEAFLSPEVIDAFARYMHKHRKQSDGRLRAGDNWQKGIPRDAYMKSGFRHFMDVWRQHRGLKGQDDLVESLCALMFNVQGYLFEVLKERKLKQAVDDVINPKGKQ